MDDVSIAVAGGIGIVGTLLIFDVPSTVQKFDFVTTMVVE
jgi:hypothetical protein